MMTYILRRLKALRKAHGQDLIEYALMAGFVAVAAGAAMPQLADQITLVFAKVGVVLYCAGTPDSRDVETCANLARYF